MTDAQTEAREIETQAWCCDEWPEWLHKIVDETCEVADRLDMSAEQAHAYAVLTALAAKDAELEQYLTDRDAELSASFDAGHYRAMSEHATPWRIRAERAEAELARRDMQLEASAKVALDLSAQLAEARKALDKAREREAEALSRTGAVKVEALVNSLLDLRDLIMRGKRCVTDTGPAVKPVIELAAVHILDDAANALEALSVLEPPAPEGQQDDDRIRREMEEILRRQSERDIPFAPATRPAEQAVTEAIQEIIRQLELTGPTRSKHCDRQTLADELRAALKAAMEAGRHD